MQVGVAVCAVWLVQFNVCGGRRLGMHMVWGGVYGSMWLGRRGAVNS